MPTARCWGCASKCSLKRGGSSFAGDVDDGAPFRVCLGFPEYFVGDRGRIPLPQQEIAQQVSKGITLRPIEVAVRLFASRIAQVEQEGGDSVRNRRALGA